MHLFDKTAYQCSKQVTVNYSTSFSLGIKVLAKKYHNPIFAIYGMVRLADEIVDTFHDHDKETLLKEFIQDTHQAIDRKISLNPILQAFQQAVHDFNINIKLIDDFFKSMETDLNPQNYDEEKYQEYIYGSAEVVGLMCLHVFCEGDQKKYNELKNPARSLGAAFQKVNFLRDIQSDYGERGRVYFPGLNPNDFSDKLKFEIEADIKKDFDDALKGIKKLPKGAGIGVYLAYVYYLQLFKKIKSCPVSQIMKRRIRIPNFLKIALLIKTYISYKIIPENPEPSGI